MIKEYRRQLKQNFHKKNSRPFLGTSLLFGIGFHPMDIQGDTARGET